MIEIASTDGLAQIAEGMDWQDRIQARIRNINILCDAVQREILLLGAQLAACKWSGEYLLDPEVWSEGDDRSWTEWLKRRNFKLVSGEKAVVIDKVLALSLMAWASCYETIVSENASRDIPLPLPTSPSQLVPYHGLLQRVDDWEPSNWPQIGKSAKKSAANTEPPYAAQQPKFVQKWQEVWHSLPPEKRVDKHGKPKPPAKNVSWEYIRAEQRMLAPDPEPPVATLNVGQEPQSPERMGQAAAEPPKVNQPPRISKAEREAQERKFRQEQDARKYRLLLLSLQQSSEALEGFLKEMLVMQGGGYLDVLRTLDLGMYSVTDDVGLLRAAVTVQQTCLRLMTEEYVPPPPIQVDPPNATVDV